jgi:hypothetical protein
LLLEVLRFVFDGETDLFDDDFDMERVTLVREEELLFDCVFVTEPELVRLIVFRALTPLRFAVPDVDSDPEVFGSDRTMPELASEIRVLLTTGFTRSTDLRLAV